MIDPRDPEYAEKRVSELLNQAINRAAAEVELPIELLHKALLDKAQDLMLAALTISEEGDDVPRT